MVLLLLVQASDVFRQAISLLVRQQQWGDAVSMLMRFGEACDAASARHSQAKAYLGAVVVWLYAGDPQQAWQVRGAGVQIGVESALGERVTATCNALHCIESLLVV